MKSPAGLLLMPSLLAFLVACDNRTEQHTNQNAQAESTAQPRQEAEAQSPRTNRVRGQAFEVEQAILEAGRLNFRNGQDFFPEQQIEIVLFADQEELFNSTMTVPGSSSSRPHIRYGVMPESGNLPDTETSMGDYTLEIDLGARQSLGVPVSIDLHDAKYNSSLQGDFFATFADIKVTENLKLDATYDSFDTQQYLGAQYITEHYPDATITHHGTTWRRGEPGRDKAKIGLVGFALSENGDHRFLRLSMTRKPNDGWQISGEIPGDQLVEAQWPEAYGALGFSPSDRTATAARLVGKRFSEQAVFPDFMGENISCSEAATDGGAVALCHVAYHLRQDDSTRCEKFAFMMEKNEQQWQFAKDVNFNQALARGGKLEEKPTDSSFFFSRDCPMLEEYKPALRL
jgi:hypothetical protein